MRKKKTKRDMAMPRQTYVYNSGIPNLSDAFKKFIVKVRIEELISEVYEW